jgi:hypothetical protein
MICNKKAVPHSKWHEVSANAFVDLVFLFDDVHRVLSGDKVFLGSDSTTDPMYCLYENACMEDFELLNGADISDDNDIIYSVMQRCFGARQQDRQHGNIGAGSNCIVMSLYMGRNETVIGDNQTIFDGIDSCLVKSNCIVFDNYGTLDESKLISCLDNTDANSCQAFVKEGKQAAIISCIYDCGSVLFCITECLQNHATLTPEAEKVISCLNAIVGISGENQYDSTFLTACTAVSTEPRPSPTTGSLLERLAKGLPRVIECAAIQCRDSFMLWNQARAGVESCIKDCLTIPSIANLPLSQHFACAMECL